MTSDLIIQRIDIAIGQTCYWWSRIEYLVHDLCLHLAHCLSLDFERSETIVPLHIALSNMELRQRIATAKAFASQAPTAEKTFYDRFERVLNRVDNELRTERNRYVHDYWDIGDDQTTIERFQQRTIVTRPQSRQRELQIGTSKTYASAQEVERFVDELYQTYMELSELDSETAAMSLELERLEELRRSTPGES